MTYSYHVEVICPRLKKPSLDSADVKNYRPISNLKVTSKLLERLVASQLMKYLQDNKLLPDHQSADTTSSQGGGDKIESL